MKNDPKLQPEQARSPRVSSLTGFNPYNMLVIVGSSSHFYVCNKRKFCHHQHYNNDNSHHHHHPYVQFQKIISPCSFMFCMSLPILGTQQKNIKDSTWFNYIFLVSIGYITMFIEVPPAKHGSLPPPDGQLLEDKGFDLGPFDPPFFICENTMKLRNITIKMPIWMMKTRGNEWTWSFSRFPGIYIRSRKNMLVLTLAMNRVDP